MGQYDGKESYSSEGLHCDHFALRAMLHYVTPFHHILDVLKFKVVVDRFHAKQCWYRWRRCIFFTRKCQFSIRFLCRVVISYKLRCAIKVGLWICKRHVLWQVNVWYIFPYCTCFDTVLGMFYQSCSSIAAAAQNEKCHINWNGISSLALPD